MIVAWQALGGGDGNGSRGGDGANHEVAGGGFGTRTHTRIR